MATVKLISGKAPCQHVSVEITIDDETRKFMLMKDELAREKDLARRFEAVLTNVKTNIALQIEEDIAKVANVIAATEFKV